MLNVGLVGWGFAGKVFHAPVIRAVEGLRLTTIVQRSGPGDPRYPDVEFIQMSEVNDAYERLLKNDVRYRFVIDMSRGL